MAGSQEKKDQAPELVMVPLLLQGHTYVIAITMSTAMVNPDLKGQRQAQLNPRVK